MRQLFPEGAEVLSLKNYRMRPDQVWRMEIKGQGTFALRLTNRTAYAKKRTAERSKMASNIGVGPHVHFVSPNGSVLITDWVVGTTGPELVPETLQKIADKVRLFHEKYQNVQSFPRLYSIGDRIGARLKDIAKATGQENLFSFLLQDIDLLEKMLKKDQPRPIHGDLNTGNIVLDQAGEVYFIDWGDSITSDPYDDLAALSFSYAMTDAEEQRLLSHYLKRLPASDERQRLKMKRLQTMLHFGLWCYLKLQTMSEWKTYREELNNARDQGQLPFPKTDSWTQSLKQWLQENQAHQSNLNTPDVAYHLALKSIQNFQEILKGLIK